MAGAMRALNDANVAIYPVDARGVTNPAFSMDPRVSASRLPLISPDMVSTHVMLELAEQSGGRAIFSGNDISGGIRRALDDSIVSYVLAYYPSHNKWDGKFRGLKVEVRQPGAEALHRRGYFALPDEPGGEQERDTVLRAAAASPLDATALGLAVRVLNPDVKPGALLNLEIELDPRELSLNEQGDQRFILLNVLLVFHDADGRNIGGRQPFFEVRMRTSGNEQARSQAVILQRQETMRPGTRELRVIVRDATSGALGSVAVPFDRR